MTPALPRPREGMARLLKSTVGRQGKAGPKGQMSSSGFYHRAEGDRLQCWWLLQRGKSPASAPQHPRVAQEPLALSTRATMGTTYFKSRHTERCCLCLGVRGRGGADLEPLRPQIAAGRTRTSHHLHPSCLLLHTAHPAQAPVEVSFPNPIKGKPKVGFPMLSPNANLPRSRASSSREISCGGRAGTQEMFILSREHRGR